MKSQDIAMGGSRDRARESERARPSPARAIHVGTERRRDQGTKGSRDQGNKRARQRGTVRSDARAPSTPRPLNPSTPGSLNPRTPGPPDPWTPEPLDTIDDAGDDLQISDAFASTSLTLTYDANGNLTADGIFKFVYDAWNRLVGVTRSIDDETSVATYAFDGLHRRASKAVTNTGPEELAGDGGETTVHFYYDSQWRILETRNGSDQATRQFMHGTQYIDEHVFMDVNGDPSNVDDCNPDTDAQGENDQDRRYFIHQDRNWNVVAVSEYDDGVGTNGEIVERYAYTPYGSFRVFSGVNANGAEAAAASGVSSVGNVFAHQGLWWDAEALLYYVRYRQYSPTLARFPQRDPLFTTESRLSQGSAVQPAARGAGDFAPRKGCKKITKTQNCTACVFDNCLIEPWRTDCCCGICFSCNGNFGIYVEVVCGGGGSTDGSSGVVSRSGTAPFSRAGLGGVPGATQRSSNLYVAWNSNPFAQLDPLGTRTLKDCLVYCMTQQNECKQNCWATYPRKMENGRDVNKNRRDACLSNCRWTWNVACVAYCSVRHIAEIIGALFD